MEELGAAEAQIGRRPGQGEGGLDVGDRDTGDHGADRQGHDLPVVAEEFDDRRAFLRFFLRRRDHLRRFGDLETDVETDEDEDRRGEERNPPAPGAEVLRAHIGQAEKGDGRQEIAHGRTLLGEGAVEDLLAGWSEFGGDEHGAAPFAAHGHALDDAENDEKDWSHEADLLIGRQKADADSCQAHKEEGGDDRILAAELVPEVAEDDAAERAGDEANGEGGEGRQRAHGRADVGEEDITETSAEAVP